MQNSFPVRYGRNYKVVLAIVLPGLLTWPFIEAMQQIPALSDWLMWVTVFSFLGIISFVGVWLAKRVYPPATLSINNNQVSLKFDTSNFLSPVDFTFRIEDITSFTRGEIGGDEYFIFVTRNPRRKFQISQSTYSVDDYLLFNQAMVEISEKVRGVEET